jgi:hypothetical protein
MGGERFFGAENTTDGVEMAEEKFNKSTLKHCQNKQRLWLSMGVDLCGELERGVGGVE